MQIRVFLSHSSKDKRLAADLKELLEALGLAVFVAHQDLKPSAQWQDRIVEELQASDVFLALLTNRFRESVWTDQEFGMAFALNKLIMPIRCRSLPHGFMANSQAHYLERSDLKISAIEIGKAIASEPNLKRRFRTQLIKDFRNCRNFNCAIVASTLISELNRVKEMRSIRLPKRW
jgi:hypothetical protein